MKYILLLTLIMIGTPIFSQQADLTDALTETVINIIDETRKPRKPSFNDIKAQHWWGMSYGIEGVSFPTLKNTTFPVQMFVGELFLGKHFYFYIKLGMYVPLSSDKLFNNIDYMLGISSVVGFGGYIYNDRSWTTGQGWSIMLNGGIAYRAGLGSTIENINPGEEYKTVPMFHNIGVELNMKFNYNYMRFLGISFGPYFTYYAYEYHSVSYGMSVGLIF